MRTYYDATRGSSAINWAVAAFGGPPMDPPDDYWEVESDLREDLRGTEDGDLDDC